MEDLIKRLNVIGYQLTFATQRATVEEAAAALAKLQAERDEAREALRPFAEANCRIVGISSSADDPLVGYAAWTEKALSLAHFRAASRALGGGE